MDGIFQLVYIIFVKFYKFVACNFRKKYTNSDRFGLFV